MNFLTRFYTAIDAHKLSISAEQGSAFAKEVAGDFNPIHDPDSKRFCVPGDLLFALALNQYGLHQQMSFEFLDLVSGDAVLAYPPLADTAATNQSVEVIGDRGRPVLGVQCNGVHTKGPSRVEALLKNYVAFSGHNFPHILVPLMRQNNVMINPKRPLVIYESMSFEFDHLDFNGLDIELGDTQLDVQGKRGNAELHFLLSSAGQQIGSGRKKLVMSGLREYEELAMQYMCDEYQASKTV